MDSWLILIILAIGAFYLFAANNENPEAVRKAIDSELKRVSWETWLSHYETLLKRSVSDADARFTWKPAYGRNEISYAHEGADGDTRKIDILNLDNLKALDFLSVEDQIRSRLALINCKDGKFPSWDSKLPKSPNLLDLDKILTTHKFSSKDQHAITDRANELNDRLKSAYDDACSESRELQVRYEAAWQSQREEERQFLASLLDDEAGIELLTSFVLRSIPFHKWMPREFSVRHDSSSNILIIEHEFVDVESVQWTKIVSLKRTTTEKAANKSESKVAEGALYPALALVIALSVSKKLELPDVDSIVVNGWVKHRSKSTGVELCTYCTSLMAPVERLRLIDWAHADAVAAFASLKGNVSRSLEFNPIAPPVRLDASDPRFVDAREILSKMSEGENLASMDWDDFEHLCRELFERVFASNGATVSVTQASRDQGVDAIIDDPDPIKGGKIVIQAKRYVNTVDVSAVRDLWGTVSHEGAMKGLLVTTSQFGPDSYSFSKDKPITLINGSELLYLLEQNGYKFRIDLEEARKLQKESGEQPFKRSRQRLS
jgi:restriction system protein